MSERLEWEVLGRVVGTATGWDQQDTWIMMLYDFEPAEGVELPSGDVSFDFERGLATTYNDEGEPVETVDLIASLMHFESAYA